MVGEKNRNGGSGGNVVLRREAMQNLASTEDLDRYIKATGPAAWLIIVSVLALLVGWLVWAAFASPEGESAPLLSMLLGSVVG